METTVERKMKTFEFSVPDVDVALLRRLAKQFGWNMKIKKSGLDKALDDVAAGRVYEAKDADDLIKQILG